MTDFDSVGDNPDELVAIILEGVTLLHESDDNANNNNNNTNNGNNNNNGIARPVCIICRTSSELTVMFLLCKHLNMCESCYGMFMANELATYIAELGDAPQLIKCPSCRTLHLPSQVLNGIFVNNN